MTTAVKATNQKTTTVTKTTQSASEATKRNQRLEDISSHRETLIQQRQKDAADSKARTLKMYDNMAKSGSAGDHRPLDINTYRGRDSGKLILSGAAIQKTDLVEETIRERVRASEENKKRLLASYDYAAKTQPSGTVRDVDFGLLKGVDGKYIHILYIEQQVRFETISSDCEIFSIQSPLSVSSFEQDKPQGSATFQMSNGVPSIKKGKSRNKQQEQQHPQTTCKCIHFYSIPNYLNQFSLRDEFPSFNFCIHRHTQYELLN